MKQPLLSICIPTRNRSQLLKPMLENLTALPTFLSSDEIEVVISDNASDDDTAELAKKYVEQFPDKIRYFCNEADVHDDNFRLALTRGTGEYLKLSNDTLLWTDDGLKLMLDSIRKYRDEKPLLYFRSLKGDFEPYHCTTLDAFVKRIGLYITWIAEYGIWKTDFEQISDFGRAKDLMLIQADMTLREMSRKKNAVVITTLFFTLVPRPVTGGGYNAGMVFGQNYCTLLRPYVDCGEITQATYAFLKRDVFLRGVFAPFVSTKPGFVFKKDHYFKYLMRDFKWKWYIYVAYPFVVAARIIAPIRAWIGK